MGPTHDSTAANFAAGNYASAALNGAADAWQTYAALGLVGKVEPAIEGLSRFDHPEARFYSGVTSWIDGDEHRAVHALKDLSTPQAQKFLALIRKKKINVLAQLDRGSQWDFIAALEKDPKFTVQNVGFKSGDQPNRPYADVHQFYDRKSPPDFYVAKLVEWHVLPPNLQELPCPILGHTADYDIHIQTVYPWLQLFDELVVTDHTEWRDVSRLTPAPVATFPKLFGLGASLPLPPKGPRPADVFISGTAMHPYHPDKARLLHQILDMPEPAVRFVNGFVSPDKYHRLLGQTKVGFTYVRHPGAMPTRGLESLAMGAAIVVQEGSVLQIFFGENEGVVTYDLEKENLPATIRRVLSQWPEFEQRAGRGAELARKEFNLARVASQYFRFLTFLASRPRGSRRMQPRERLDQKRSILVKGWVQAPRVNRQIREQSLVRWAERLGPLNDAGQRSATVPSAASGVSAGDSARAVIDLARELMLEYATAAYPPAARDYSRNFAVTLAVQHDLLTQALQLYRLGVRRFPSSLVLRFNWIRAALHFGEREEVSEALALAEETIKRPSSEWRIDARDDVFPWDYLSQFFNYRAYFDLSTLHLQTGEPVPQKLAELILASIHYYLSFYASDSASEFLSGVAMPGDGRARGPAGGSMHALAAVKLDPEFPFYKLQCARQLIRSENLDAYPLAGVLLAELVRNSMLFLQAFEVLQVLQDRELYTHPQFDELAAKVKIARQRIFTAGYGVEDWDAIPLRLRLEDALIASKGSSSGEQESEPAARPTRILFLPLEFADWKEARHLAYPAQFGLEEGLTANGVQFVTLPMVRGLSEAARNAWLRRVQKRCEAQPFDQVWVEIVHSEWDHKSLSCLKDLAPKRVGFLLESLCYDEQSYAVDSRLRHRQTLVEGRLKYLTHLVAVDEEDASRLNGRALVRAEWWPQAVPGRCIRSAAHPAPDKRALFYGQVYGARQAWLDCGDLRHLLLRPDQSPEDAAKHPVLFDSLNRAFASALERGVGPDEETFAEYTDALRRLRRESFELWLTGLQQGCAVVNLPSLFSGYAGRVYEAMAASRPVISWEVPDRPRTRDLFQAHEEILLYPKNRPEALGVHIRHVQREPDWARNLAQKAQTKLLGRHTVERRVAQILDWIETGREMDFGVSGESISVRGDSVPERRAGAFRNPERISVAMAGDPSRSESSQAPISTATTELLLATAKARLHFGENKLAHRHLARVAVAQPRHPDVQVELATAAARLGQWSQCLAALRPVLEYEPDHPQAWKLLGDLALKYDQAEQATEIQRLLMLRTGNDPAVCIQLASIFLQSDQTMHADRTFEISIDCQRAQESARTAASQSAAPQDDVIALSQSIQELAVRQLPAAWSLARRRMSKQGFEVPAVARLGFLGEARDLFQRECWLAAWKAAMAALAVRPFHPEAYLLLAGIARASGDEPLARECAKRCREMAPKWHLSQQFLKSPVKRAAPQISLPPLPPRSRRPRISVCLITKNEERFVGRCLESVRDIADQIVVVDTGSLDWTPDIAKRFGAEVYSFMWVDDFSAARNAALEKATGDWILMLDADEELPAEQRENLRKLVEDKSAIAWRLPMVDEGHEDAGVSYVPRLYRNAPALFYVGRIHEQIFASLEVRRAEWGLENKFGDAVLLHHGYTKELVKSRDKIARNLRLLRLANDEMPGEPNLLMNLGLELVRDGQIDNGLMHYAEAVRVLSTKPAAEIVPELRETLLTQFASHLIRAKAFREVVTILNLPLAQRGGLTASMHFLLGLAHLELKQHREAAQEMRLCLAKRQQPVLSPVHEEIRKGAPSHCLAVCLAALQQTEAAHKAFRDALKDDPESRPVRAACASFLADNGAAVEALNLLHELVDEKPSDAVAWQMGGQIALSKPEFLEVAGDWTAEAIQNCPDHPALNEQRGRALLLSGQPESALPFWRRIASAGRSTALAGLIISEAAAGESIGAWPQAADATLSAEFLKWYRQLIDFGAEQIILKLNQRLADLALVVPEAAARLRTALAEAA